MCAVIFNRFLVAILAFQLSGAAVVLSNARADATPSQTQPSLARSIQIHLEKIKQSARNILLQQKFPGTLTSGQAWFAEGRAPLQQQVNSLVIQQNQLKKDVETFITLPFSDVEFKADREATDRAQMLQDYFTTLSGLTVIYGNAGMLTAYANWNSENSFKVPYPIFEKITRYDLSQGGKRANWYKDLLNNTASAMIYAPHPDSPDTAIQLSLNKIIVELVRAQTQPGTAGQNAYFDTVKKMILVQLEGDPTQGQADPLSNPLVKETLLRQALSEQIKADKLPAFSTEELVGLAFDAVFPLGTALNANAMSDALNKIKAGEKIRFTKQIIPQLVAYPILLRLHETDDLAEIIASAKLGSIVLAISQLIDDPTFNWTAEEKLQKKEELTTVLIEYTKSYSDLLKKDHSVLLKTWFQASESKLAQAVAEIPGLNYQKKLKQILLDAKKIKELKNTPDSQTKLIPILLYIAAGANVSSFDRSITENPIVDKVLRFPFHVLPIMETTVQPTITVRKLLSIIMSAPNYGLARKAFYDAKATLTNGQDKAQFAMVEKIFGFASAPTANREVFLSEIELSDSIKEAYRSILINEILADPILTLPINDKPLYEALNQLGDGETQQAYSLIQTALKTQREKVQAVANKVRSANKPEDLQDLIGSSGTLDQLILQQHPELIVTHQKVREQLQYELRDTGTFGHLSHAYFGPMSALLPFMLTQGLVWIGSKMFRPSLPIFRTFKAFERSLMPALSSYMIAGMVVMVPEFFLQANGAYRMEERSDRMTEYFEGSPSANALLSYWDVEGARTEAKAAWIGVGMSAAMNVAFFGIPAFVRVGELAWTRAWNGKYARLFETIGMPREQVNWNEAAIKASAEAQSKKTVAEATSVLAASQALARINKAEKALLRILEDKTIQKTLFVRDFKKDFDLLEIAEAERGFELEKIDLAFAKLEARAARGEITPAALEQARKASHQIETYVMSQIEPVLILSMQGKEGRYETVASLFQQVYSYQLRPQERMDNLVNLPDYYALLGVQPTASDAEIQQAFRMMQMKYHPDRIRSEQAARGENNPEAIEQAREISIQINDAYKILKDPLHRARYERAMAQQSSGGQR